MELIEKLVLGEMPTIVEIQEELYEICDRTHSSCDSSCPVYRLNGNEVPDTAKDFKVNRGCDCFKSGKNMYEFIFNALNQTNGQ